MTDRWDVGNMVTVKAESRDEDGALADATTVIAAALLPDGTVGELTPTHQLDEDGDPIVGKWKASLLLTDECSGDTTWVRFAGTVGLIWAGEVPVYVRERHVPDPA